LKREDEMRTPRPIPQFLLMATIAACSQDGGNVLSNGTTADAGANASVSAADAANGAVTAADAAPAKNADASSRLDAHIAATNFPVSCVPDMTYQIDLCSEWECPDGTTAKSVCNATGDGYYLWEDTQSVCGCPNTEGGTDGGGVPVFTPPATADASTPPPAASRDAAGWEFPVFSPVLPPDAAQIDAPQPSILPDASANPDTAKPTFVFPTFPGPEAPDAQIAASTPPDAEPTKADAKLPPDTATPQPRLDCGCQEPTPPAIIADAMPPDTTPIALPPDAGAPDVIIVPDMMPDIVPNTTPDTLPDTKPDTTPDTTPPPDAGCTSVVSITITASELVCGTMIDWTVVGCSPMGFKVVWSLNEGPTYPTRAGDNYNYVSDPTARSHEIHDVNGAGTYYVRVCQYIGGACGVYSNELIVSMDK